jgi:pyridinium-3,5-bisthiocarboxylic acid mononucleotide nickel chelatase
MTDAELKAVLEAVQRGELGVDEAASQLAESHHDGPAEVDHAPATDEIRVIETHIDDMSPEHLGFLMERLFAEGALDVAFSPLQMKKNRPAVRLTVLASPHLLEHISRFILLESTAIGVRHYPAQRLKLERTVEPRETSLGPVQVKVLSDGGRVVRVAPEFEECRRLARETGLPIAEVYRVVERETASRT